MGGAALRGIGYLQPGTLEGMATVTLDTSLTVIPASGWKSCRAFGVTGAAISTFPSNNSLEDFASRSGKTFGNDTERAPPSLPTSGIGDRSSQLG